MTFRKIPGQDTQQFNNWPWKVQANRKVLHLEVYKGETKFIEKLVEVVKEKKILLVKVGQTSTRQ